MPREGGTRHNELDAGRWFEALINRKKNELKITAKNTKIFYWWVSL